MKRLITLLPLIISICLLCACGTSTQGMPQADGGASTETPADNGLLDGASPETSALSIYEWDGSTLTRHTLYETAYVTEILKELRSEPVFPVPDDWTPEKLSTPVYGLEIGKTDGFTLEAAWSNGVWIAGDGTKYSFDYPFQELFARYQWDEDIQNSIATIPCARHLAEYEGKWYPGFMAKAAQPEPPAGISMALTEQTDKALTVTFLNQSGAEWDYGTYYSLDVEIDGVYYSVPTTSGGNWGFEDIGIILPDGESQTRQYDLTSYGTLPDGDYRIVASGISAEFTIGEKTLAEYHEPPSLTVSCGDNAVPASGTTYSWEYLNADGIWSGVEADGPHPLEMMDNMTPLAVDSSGDVELFFELAPDETTVSYWPEEYAGDDYDAFTEHLDQAMKLSVENGCVTVPTDENYIYEVWAKWSDGAGAGGTAYYGFWTVVESTETAMAVPEPPSTMPMPMGRDPEAIKAYLGTFSNDHLELKDRQDVITENAIRMDDGQFSLSDTGWSLWNQFMEKTQAGKETAVVIIRFTVEGDAMPTYLHYDGTSYYVMEDTTRDAFGNYGYLEYLYAGLQEEHSDYGGMKDGRYIKQTTLQVLLTDPIDPGDAGQEYSILYAPEHSEDMGIPALESPTQDETVIQVYLDAFPDDLESLCEMERVYIKRQGTISNLSEYEWSMFTFLCDEMNEPADLTVVDEMDGTVSYVSFDGSDFLMITRTAPGVYDNQTIATLSEVKGTLGVME